MEIPSLFYGRYAEVNARCRDLVRRLRRGVAWTEAVDGPLLDTRDRPGLLVLNGPSPLIDDAAHFQCYQPYFRVRDAVGQGRLSADVEAAVFAASLETPWGLLGLLAPANVIWVHLPERYRPLLQAGLRYWSVLDAEGSRYSVGMAEGQPLWSIPNNLKHVLANLGVPIARLQSPLPPGGLAELVGRVDVGSL